MLIGLDKFKQHFKGASNQYVLIGGAACDILYEAQGLEFRATKDFDIVLCIEVLEPGFFIGFWDFIIQAGYQVKEKDGRRGLYRFKKPMAPGYPIMIELFSKKPDMITLPKGAILTPIPSDGEASDLSAILMDDISYKFLMDQSTNIDGVTLARAEALIPLKAYAWANLLQDQGMGRPIDTKDIKKHHRDIYRLARLLTANKSVQLPQNLATSLRSWLKESKTSPLDPADEALGGLSSERAQSLIAKVFDL
jgi:hypothetical protein